MSLIQERAASQEGFGHDVYKACIPANAVIGAGENVQMFSAVHWTYKTECFMSGFESLGKLKICYCLTHNQCRIAELKNNKRIELLKVANKFGGETGRRFGSHNRN